MVLAENHSYSMDRTRKGFWKVTMPGLWRLRAVVRAVEWRLRQNGPWLYKLSQVQL